MAVRQRSQMPARDIAVGNYLVNTLRDPARQNADMAGAPALERRLSFALLTLYGLGTILGAGIFVLLGAVVAIAGPWTPLAFLLAAAIAAVTALTYVELVGRLPFCAGEAIYVEEAFARPYLTRGIGLAVVLVAIVSSATIVNGCVAYLDLIMPMPRLLAITGMISVLTGVAIVGIALSAWVASLMTAIGIAGLVFVISIAGSAMDGAAARAALIPPGDWPALGGIAAGAFLAFYAFLGFEDMINVAEEVHDVRRVLPRAILTALAIATVLYVLVALTAVTTVPLAMLAGREAPLAVIIAPYGVDARLIAGVSVLAVINGALVQTVKAARVLYGLGRAGYLPARLARIAPRTHTPAIATTLVGCAILGFATAFDFVLLAQLTSLITLLLFATVNLALIVIRRRDDRDAGVIPAIPWLPATGFVLTIALVAAEIVTTYTGLR
jgi:basic amino acid/polyamine antiporter, APA family